MANRCSKAPNPCHSDDFPQPARRFDAGLPTARGLLPPQAPEAPEHRAIQVAAQTCRRHASRAFGRPRRRRCAEPRCRALSCHSWRQRRCSDRVPEPCNSSSTSRWCCIRRSSCRSFASAPPCSSRSSPSTSRPSVARSRALPQATPRHCCRQSRRPLALKEAARPRKPPKALRTW